MPLRDKIETDYKNALKSKHKNKISTYRLILSGIKDLDISNRSGPDKKDTDENDIKKLLKKMIKQRSESIEVYKKSDRNDLLEIEQEEVNVLSDYLPKQLGEDETKKICSLFNLNPLETVSEGTLLITVKKNKTKDLIKLLNLVAPSIFEVPAFTFCP